MSAHIQGADIAGRAADCPLCHHKLAIETDHHAMTPESCEFTADNDVKVTFRTTDGDVIHAIMTTTALMHLVTMAVALVNSNTAQVLSDIATT